MLVQERGLGTTADVSVVASSVSVVSFLVGIAYGKVSKTFGPSTPVSYTHLDVYKRQVSKV